MYIYNNLLDDILVNDIINDLNEPIDIYSNEFESNKLLTFYNKQRHKNKLYKKYKYILYIIQIILFILFNIFLFIISIIFIYFYII